MLTCAIKNKTRDVMVSEHEPGIKFTEKSKKTSLSRRKKQSAKMMERQNQLTLTEIRGLGV